MADLSHDFSSARSHLLAPLVACLLLTAVTLACGSDDDKPTDTPKGGTGGDGTSAGRSGSAGTRTVSTGVAGAVAPPEPVECGSTMCYPQSNPLAGLLSMAGAGLGGALPMVLPCCVDDAVGTCGSTMTAGGLCAPPAVSDSRCPALDLGAAGALGAGIAMVGCCIDNACGQDGSILGGGCIENSQASSMLSAIPLIGNLATVPPALACDRPIETTNDRDAGSEDAGS